VSKDRQRVVDYLAHMLQAIERIALYTQLLSEATFLQNHLVQDAVIRNLEVVGEASNNILKHYPEFAAQHPELPLAFAYQMRNAIAHGYFKVDYEIIWQTIQADLPALAVQVENAITSLGKSS
jgi:uncharacterized protein with HEPN domain